MKKLLILSLSLITFFGHAQTLVDPTLSPTTARINAALMGTITASGTDTYTADIAGLTTYTGAAFSVTFTNANTGSSTLNLTNTTPTPDVVLGAKTIRKFEGGTLVNLVAGDISAGETKRLRYNGTYLVIEGGSGSGGGGISELEVGVTDITSGTTTRVLYDNAGTLGEYSISGTGNVAMTTSPVFTTPNIGSATGSISGNAATVTTNANLTGDVTSTGNATAIASGVIVDADVNASAAIAGTKLANTAAGGISATTVQAAINELDAEKVSTILTRNRVTADYTLVLTDNFKFIEMNSGTAKVITIPPNSSVAFTADQTQITIGRYGAGTVTIAPGAGVTIRSSDGVLGLRSQYSTAVLIKIGTDEWYLIGDIQ